MSNINPSPNPRHHHHHHYVLKFVGCRSPWDSTHASSRWNSHYTPVKQEDADSRGGILKFLKYLSGVTVI